MPNLEINHVINLLLEKLKEHEEKIEALNKDLDALREEVRSATTHHGAKLPEKPADEEQKSDNFKTILVVDDDPNLVNTFKLVLENVGFRVDTASNGIKALYKVTKLHYDLVIIDMNLPDMLGDELAKRIHSKAPYMKIIIITGYGSYMEELEKDNQIKRVLMKPIPPEDLVEIAKQTITKE